MEPSKEFTGVRHHLRKVSKEKFAFNFRELFSSFFATMRA